jgi:uncharacterized protein
MLKRLLVCFFLLGLVASPVQALEFPEPQGFVNDFAGILSAETRQQLEDQLARLEKDSSVEIAVVTVESLQKTTIEDYAARLFETWQIGKKDRDNGVLLLIAPNERKLRIEVGYGLEPVLTDSKAGRVIRNIITPRFKDGDYDAGITAGVAAITKIVRGEEVALDPKSSTSVDQNGDGTWALLAIGIVFLSYLTSFFARSKRFWPGGLLGALLGAVLGAVLASILLALLLALGLGLLGLLFDYVLSKNYKKRQDKGLPTNWWHSGGGFFGGRGSGFGGFGGGSSGGGGASGSW